MIEKGSSRCLKVGGTKKCSILLKATWPRLLQSSRGQAFFLAPTGDLTIIIGGYTVDY